MGRLLATASVGTWVVSSSMKFPGNIGSIFHPEWIGYYCTLNILKALQAQDTSMECTRVILLDENMKNINLISVST